MIARKAEKSGDGSHNKFLSHEMAHATSLWGYGDKDLDLEDFNELQKLKS
jgi:hypothetical protein